MTTMESETAVAPAMTRKPGLLKMWSSAKVLTSAAMNEPVLCNRASSAAVALPACGSAAPSELTKANAPSSAMITFGERKKRRMWVQKFTRENRFTSFR